MSWDDVQALLLRNAHAPAVRHLLFRVAPEARISPSSRKACLRKGGAGGEALEALKELLEDAPLTLGPGRVEGLHCTLGFTFEGLEALGMPVPYLQVFARLAPAFKQGAPSRAAHIGDTGSSAPATWDCGFREESAHVLLTLHGEADAMQAQIDRWKLTRKKERAVALRLVSDQLSGHRLGAPPGESGEWVHFGLRDGLLEHRLAGVPHLAGGKSHAMHVVDHAAGEFLLGHASDMGANPFLLPLAPKEVRGLFRNSSFGVLRKMEQDVQRFEQAVERWVVVAQQEEQLKVSTDWVKAKLSGRWPSGEAIRPGQFAPGQGKPADEFLVDFTKDKEATGCPWFAHVRRMDARGHAGAGPRPRSLLRRSMPYGPAAWDAQAQPGPRGLLGLFFCGSLEDQFELLVGQWSNGPPPGRPAIEAASDPLAGHHPDGVAKALIPLGGGKMLPLAGFSDWTQTRGTLYTWHPDGTALKRILCEEYVEKDDAPWL